MKIVDIVWFNKSYAYVLDADVPLTYELVDCGPAVKNDWESAVYGSARMIGTDATGSIVDVLYHDVGSYRKAFGGQEHKLLMKDGSVYTSDGWWYSGGAVAAERYLQTSLINFTHNTAARLAECYVFCGSMIKKEKLREMIAVFNDEHPYYLPMAYYEYEEKLKASALLKGKEQHK